MARTDAQVLLAQGRREGRREGREEGREEGRIEGRLEGQREMVLEQLAFKFGPLPAETRAAVEALTEPQINELAVRILTAQTLAELGL